MVRWIVLACAVVVLTVAGTFAFWYVFDRTRTARRPCHSMKTKDSNRR